MKSCNKLCLILENIKGDEAKYKVLLVLSKNSSIILVKSYFCLFEFGDFWLVELALSSQKASKIIVSQKIKKFLAKKLMESNKSISQNHIWPNSIFHSGPENLKKSRPKNSWNQINQFHQKKSIFLQFQKWPKINSWTREKF